MMDFIRTERFTKLLSTWNNRMRAIEKKGVAATIAESIEQATLLSCWMEVVELINTEGEVA